MTITIYFLSIALFCLTTHLSNVAQTVRESITISLQAIETVSDSHLDELDKERVVRNGAVKMIRNNGILLLKVGFTLVVAALPVWFADFMDLVSMEETGRFALRWDVIVLTTVAMIPIIVLFRKKNNNR